MNALSEVQIPMWKATAAQIFTHKAFWFLLPVLKHLSQQHVLTEPVLVEHLEKP